MEKLTIIAYYRPESDKNAFAIRGEVSERYESLYKWLSGGKCSARSVYSDMPWDVIVFDDPFDEQSFLVFYEGDIEFSTMQGDEPYRPLPKIKYKQGVVPAEERVIGQSYLGNCGHYHVHQDPNRDFMGELADTLAAEISREIDNEILEQLRKEFT
jgi:hypothetical protein